MQRVSTNFTFFLKIAFPIMWMVFFGAFTLAVLFSGETNFGAFSITNLKTILPICLLLGAGLLYWSVMRLKRVEMDNEFLYATNYFKTYRYPYHNIEKVVEKDYSMFKTVHIYLKEKGNFGKKMSFVASRKRLQDFLNTHPIVVEQLVGK